MTILPTAGGCKITQVESRAEYRTPFTRGAIENGVLRGVTRTGLQQVCSTNFDL